MALKVSSETAKLPRLEATDGTRRNQPLNGSIGGTAIRIGAKVGVVVGTIALVLIGTAIALLGQPSWPLLIGCLILGAAVALAAWVSDHMSSV
jgi:hypothetical protein